MINWLNDQLVGVYTKGIQLAHNVFKNYNLLYTQYYYEYNFLWYTFIKKYQIIKYVFINIFWSFQVGILVFIHVAREHIYVGHS